MYQECSSWLSTCSSAAGRLRRNRSRIQWPTWSRQGPEMLV